MAKTIIFNQNTEKFLKKNKIKTIFIINFLKQHPKKESQRIKLDARLESLVPENIAGFFAWNVSNEGLDYWRGIYARAIRFERDLIQIPK